MANKKFRKVLSLVLAIAMVASMFVCMSTINASAAVDISTRQVTDDSERSYLQAGGWNWYKMTYWQYCDLKAGKTYVFNIDMFYFQDAQSRATIAGAPVNLYCDKGSTSLESKCSTYLDNGMPTELGTWHRTVKFTPSENITMFGLSIGSADNKFCAFKASRPGLYNTNKKGEPIEGNLMSELKAGVGYDWICQVKTYNHWAAPEACFSTRGASEKDSDFAYNNNNICPAMTSEVIGQLGSSITFGEPDKQESGFDLEEEYPSQGTTQSLYFSNGASMSYYNDGRQIVEGTDYELGFECDDANTDNIFAEVYINGKAQEVDTYYEENVFTASFTASESTVASQAESLKIVIGTTSGEAIIAKPYLKEYDNDQFDVKGINLIHGFASNTIAELEGDPVVRNVNKKWNYDEGAEDVVEAYDYSGLTPATGFAEKKITFKNGATSSVSYTDNLALAAGDYRLVLGCRRYYLDELTVTVNADDVAVTGTPVYDDTNRTLTYDFTLTDAASKIDILLEGDSSTSLAIGKPALYSLVSGEISGSSLIAGMNSGTVVASGNRKWIATGNCVTSDVTDIFFTPNGGTEDVQVFEGGHDNHWGYLCFRSTTFYLRPNTKFYLLVDVYSATDRTLDRKFIFSKNGTLNENRDMDAVSVPAGVDSNEHTQAYLMQFWSAGYNDFAVIFGAFNNTSDTFAIKNARLIAVDTASGTVVSNNIFEPCNEENFYPYKANGDSKYGKTGSSDTEGMWYTVNLKSTDFKLYENTTENEAYYYPTFADAAARLTNIVNAILGKTYNDNIFVDANSDGEIDILDLVTTKKNIASKAS